MTVLIEKVKFEIIDEKEWLEKLRVTAKKNGAHIICISNELVTGEKHVRAAVWQALRAHEENRKIAHSLEMEVLLSVAGSRQCHEAVNFGVRKGLNFCYLCIISTRQVDPALIRELMNYMEPVTEDWEIISEGKMFRIMDQLKITPSEISIIGKSRLTELVIERIALLELNR